MPDTKESRAEAQRRVVEALAQHSSYLYRASTASSNRVKAIIDEMGATLSRELSDRLDNLTRAELQALTRGKYTTTRLEGIRNVIETWSRELDRRMKATFAEDGGALAASEVKYTTDLLNGVLAESVAVGITAQQAYKAAIEQPVLGQFVEDMLSELSDRTKRQVYSTVRQGVSQGATNEEIVRSLRGTRALQFKDGVLQTTRVAAERIVRTGRNHISNSAYDQTYAALNVEYVMWSSQLDGRTSKVCASRDAERYRVTDNHPKPPAHPNCLLGDSHVTACGAITNASKRWFDGEVIIIRTASGREITCTPNHPILTSAGWVAAEMVDRVGDVASYFGGKWMRPSNGKNEHVIPTIHEVTEAFFSSPEVTAMPVPTSAEHFHGDGAGSEIAIIGTNSLLRDDLVAKVSQHIAQFDFIVRAPLPSGRFPKPRPLALALKRILLAASSFVRLLYNVSDLLRAGRRHSGGLLLASVSGGSSAAQQSFSGRRDAIPHPVGNGYKSHSGIMEVGNSLLRELSDSSPVIAHEIEAAGLEDASSPLLRDTELAGHILNGTRFEDVAFDNVVYHRRRPFSGHVYNLETESGYYYANGIVTHNCRSVLVPSFDGDIQGKRPYVRAFQPVGRIPKGKRTEDMIGQVSANTTYADWFARQPAGFQKEWLGAKRYSLYKSGDYTLDRFVDPLGKEYNLAELEARDRDTFAQLFGE